MVRHSLALILAVVVGPLLPPLLALKPERAVTQYTKSVWTQSQGLPSDGVSALAQTSDGYLWVGTSDGLARFDGSEFVVFDDRHGPLPSDSITSLAAGEDNILWIGTPGGLTRYKGGEFRTFTTKEGLPDNNVTAMASDRHGVLWVIAGNYLCQFHGGRVEKLWMPGRDLPISEVSTVYVDRADGIWIAGYGGVARFASGRWIRVAVPKDYDDFAILALVKDRKGALWMGSYQLRVLDSDGHVRKYKIPSGLGAIRSLVEDVDGNIWVGTTTGGLLRFEGDHFSSFLAKGSQEQGRVSCVYEDRDGDVWAGMSNGLYRFRDDPVTIYSQLEGLPSNTPTAVYQDRHGTLWVGFRDAGLVRFDAAGFRAFPSNGVPRTEVFSIRETPGGDILVSTLEGLARWHRGDFKIYVPDHSFGRKFIFDALEDHSRHTWVAYGGGLSELLGHSILHVIPGGLLRREYMLVLCVGTGSTLWAGSEGNGIWRLEGDHVNHFTRADGLSSNEIRALAMDADGTLWIGTLGGGLMNFKDGQFIHFSADQGLLSDNIFQIKDDNRGSLWLSTSRGICRVAKQQLTDLAAHKIARLTPTTYTEKDGIVGVTGQSTFTSDGRFWTPTRVGLAVIDPNTQIRSLSTPMTYVREVKVGGRDINLNKESRLSSNTRSIEIRFAAVSVSAPERLLYSFKLEGLDPEWIPAGTRRTATYYNLRPGDYRFVVRAEFENSSPSEAEYNFEVLPYFYQQWWFRSCLLLAILLSLIIGYHLHLRQIRQRFALILEERSHLAREIHDTLAQGFVGISSQLEAVSMSINDDIANARSHLELALGMARYSLTEARWAIADLRTTPLESADFLTVLKCETTRWTLRAAQSVHVDIRGNNHKVNLPSDVQQHLLRIAQEAVNNAMKHGSSKNLWIRVEIESQCLCVFIVDDGRGFVRPDLTSPAGGHFGLIGMRERADRIGGEFKLQTAPGQGTVVGVRVPFS